MKRKEILNEAEKCVCGQRTTDYGTPENNFATIASFWTTYLAAAHAELHATRITAKDVAMMMSLLKVARAAKGDTADSFVDLAGYAACAGEIATVAADEEERTRPYPPMQRCNVCNTTYPWADVMCPSCGEMSQFHSQQTDETKEQ